MRKGGAAITRIEEILNAPNTIDENDEEGEQNENEDDVI